MSRTGITAPWWTQLRWLATIAAAVSVLVAGVLVTAAVLGERPESVVVEYLTALENRDAERALEFASEVSGLDSLPHDLLVPEAMSAGWTATRVVRRHNEDDEPANVDVTITAADGTSREGRFAVALDEDGDWRILNPLVKLGVEGIPADFVEFNGIRSTEKELWVFPGVYRAYPSLEGIVDLPDFVAVPVDGGGWSEDQDYTAATSGYLPLFGFAPDFAAAFERDVKAWIDACAATSEPNPGKCPFHAGDDLSDVRLADNAYEAETVVWEVLSYPVVRLTQRTGAFDVVVVEQGEIRISGEGEARYEDDGEPRRFTGTCSVRMDGATAVLTADGFALAPGSHPSTCALPYL
ncbi:hypothetical protein AB0I28_02555 [Phytomonospora sp. NPDC050363]|uniref:hypothetical protein n=1 Tax=Phytomonospora sp. NPDC050363 TaxID=3155642 RepID=UPI0033C1F2FC